MKYLLLLIFVNFILNVNGIADDPADFFKDVIVLFRDILQFYRSSGIYLVVDVHDGNITALAYNN